MKFRIHSFDTLSSTLDEAAKSTYSHLDVIVARFQSEGRGQRGNRWHSGEGLNLMCSIVVSPTHIAVNEQFAISMISALATARTIGEFGVSNVTIKWPNDIYVGDKKISGMLIEHSFSSEMLARSIIGIGINVAQTKFSSDAGHPTSLHTLGATTATVEQVLDVLCEKFSELYTLPIDQLHKLYIENLYRGHGEWRWEDHNGEFTARILSIDPRSGVITLCDSAGRNRSYYFKEVSYIASV